MNFNSLSYLFFLPAALILYHSQPHRARRYVLLGLSLLFLAFYAPVYVLPLLYCTAASYFTAILVTDRPMHKRLWVTLCAVMCLGLLAVFKYTGFFADTVFGALTLFGANVATPEFNIMLPMGISFYTFAVLGYVVDVYRGDVKCERDFIDYALFSSFFAPLASGPISRAGDLLPQLKRARGFSWEYVKDGETLILWGLFKKLVIADNLSTVVSLVYSSPSDYNGLHLIAATAAFAVQLYCDFSAYTDLARGSAALFGIKLARNFDAPYLALSVKDFWRRWHISLSSWFRDYLYFPLGGSRKGRLRTYLNVLIVFALSGLWHGAAGHFILWGLLNGAYQIVGSLTLPWRKKLRSALHIRENGALANAVSTVCTFFFVCVAWVFFRADTATDGVFIIKRVILWCGGLFTNGFGFDGLLTTLGLSWRMAVVLVFAVAVLFAADILSQKTDVVRSLAAKTELRYAVWFALLCLTVLLGAYGDGFSPSEFVYFQF